MNSDELFSGACQQKQGAASWGLTQDCGARQGTFSACSIRSGGMVCTWALGSLMQGERANKQKNGNNLQSRNAIKLRETENQNGFFGKDQQNA